MKIGNYEIQQKGKPFIIAEISQNHDGSLGQAHAFIDAVAETGANAIKFQTHIAEEESTLQEAFRVNFSYQDNTRYAYWKRMEFTENQWKGLYDHANEKGLIFLSSPFSEKALFMLDKIGIPAWKFGAGEVFNDSLLKQAVKTGKPLILSTGLSTYQDIEKQLNIIGNENVAILQCVTAYPSRANQIDIRQVDKLYQKYKVPCGISDHSATIYPALAAVTLGACIVEVHVTMSKYMFGPDIKASVDINQLKEIVAGSKFIYEMNQHTTNLCERSQEQEDLRTLFSKSLYYKKKLKAGETVKSDCIIGKKPNKGIPMEYIEKYIGRMIKHNVNKDDPVREEDFKDEIK